jgi:hypothetical protein
MFTGTGTCDLRYEHAVSSPARVQQCPCFVQHGLIVTGFEETCLSVCVKMRGLPVHGPWCDDRVCVC